MTTENSVPEFKSGSGTERVAAAGPPVAEAIFKSFIARTAVAELPGPFKFLDAPRSVRKLTTSPAELTEALLSEFTLDDLQQSRLFTKRSGPPRLSAALGAESGDGRFVIPDGSTTPTGIFS